MKATYGEVQSQKMDARGAIECREIFKDPITDDGTKKSAKGLLYIQKNETNGDYELIDQVDSETEAKGELQTVFINGKLVKTTSLEEIRERLK